MKKVTGFVLTVVFIVSFAHVAFADSYVLQVNGMQCRHCANRLERSLQAIEGVDSVAFDLKAKQVILALENEHSLDKDVLREAITDVGFILVKIESTSGMSRRKGFQ